MAEGTPLLREHTGNRIESSNLSPSAILRAFIAQLVERNLPKVEVAGSRPAGRSKFLGELAEPGLLQLI